ncbi:hemerythrin domain-containing protein [Undibacterium sp. WLHG33]|uniref:hemerythrin domain-containing protein n=1 Tax=Undibacterium sp. WLHG33 TaxID=3412482 RepID=UPI003C2F559F
MCARNFHPISVDIIQQEHQHLSAVIQTMLDFVRSTDKGEAPPDLKLFRAILFYICEYPEKVHHPKEDKFLFSKIKERTHQLDNVLDALIEQHGNGEYLVRNLQNALLKYEFFGVPAFPHFRDLAEQYALFYYAHMQTEENEVLPVAKLVLNVNDWQEVDQAFMENRHQLDGAGERYRYEQLFSYIISHSSRASAAPDPL